MKQDLIKKLKFLCDKFHRKISKNSERLHPEFYKQNIYDNVLYLKHQFAYEYASKYLKNEIYVLDYGCGDGYGSYYLAQKNVDCNVIGSDVDNHTVHTAKEKYHLSNLNFSTVQKLNTNTQKFDLIVSFQVIEHVKNVQHYLEFLKNRLSENGILIISTPSRNYRLNENQKPWNPFHLREYNMHDFVTDIEMTFPDTVFYSLSAVPEILKIEFERVSENRASKTMYMAEQYATVQYDTKREYTTNDFFLSEENSDNGLDLFAVSIKK
jgi:cyclopropane fatty-acyl-phospholipid synthase-like methyltransferase